MLKLLRWGACVSSTALALPSGIQDEGKDLLLDTMSNQYTGDQAGLPGFYQDQVKAGLGQLDKIIKCPWLRRGQRNG